VVDAFATELEVELLHTDRHSTLIETSYCASLQSAKSPVAMRFYSILCDLWTLTKPEVNFMIAMATFAGFCLGRADQTHPFPFSLALRTIIGTICIASGAGALNQYVERQFDAQMRRTARRPLAAGRLNPSVAFVFGITMAVVGGAYLAVAVNLLASGLAGVTMLAYLLIYTPLKRKSPVCTLIGALSGAMPPLIGWAAATGSLSSGAWVLYAILFLWQFPHFMAIAWLYRDDYDRAGYCVLPPPDGRNAYVNWMTIVPLIALIPLSICPWLSGNVGPVYKFGSLVAGAAFLYCGCLLALHKANLHARRLLLTSVVYLPVLFTLAIANHYIKI
jgi:protoheme IX farnesyltransferase